MMTMTEITTRSPGGRHVPLDVVRQEIIDLLALLPNPERFTPTGWERAEGKARPLHVLYTYDNPDGTVTHGRATKITIQRAVERQRSMRPKTPLGVALQPLK